MSTKTIPMPASTTVCDLCGKPITQEDHDDTYAMWVGGGGNHNQPKDPGRTWLQMWRGWAKRVGGPREGAVRGQDIRWDFHGKCLISALQPLIDKEVSE